MMTIPVISSALMTTIASVGPLQGVLVVIDPGHGGLDHGASGVAPSGDQVHEHPHVMDVALRLARGLRTAGASTVFTVRDPRHTTPKDIEQGKILPHDGSGVIPGRRCSVIVSSPACLEARLEVGTNAVERYKGPAVWISVHFDSLPSKLMGARVIGPKYDSMLLAEKVAGAFAETPDRAMRFEDGGEWGPSALRKGDKEHGIREIYVLSQQNEIADRILVEIGNFNNSQDLWRIRDPLIREEYGCRIVNGIIAWRANELNIAPIMRSCTQPSFETVAKVHIVKKGEWPATIARQYGVGLGALLVANQTLMDGKYRELCGRDSSGKRAVNNAFCRRPEDTLLPGWKINVP